MWDEELGQEIEADPDRRVHARVFALNTIEQQERYDPLDLDRREFRAVPHIWLRRCGQRSGSPSFFDHHGFEPVRYEGLSAAVEDARSKHEELLG